MTRSPHRRRRRGPGLTLPLERELFFSGQLLYLISSAIGFIASILTFIAAKQEKRRNDRERNNDIFPIR